MQVEPTRDVTENRPEENRGISGAQSEGSAGRSNPLVLSGLRQEFHRFSSRSPRGLSGKASGQLRPPEKRITICEQAPDDGGLFCLVIIPSPLAKVMDGNEVECGIRWFGNAIANAENYKTITNGGAMW